MSAINASAELLMESITKTTLNIVNHFDQDEQKKMIEELSEIVKQNCFLEEKIKHVKTVSEDLIQSYSIDDEIEVNMKKVFDKYEEKITAFDPDISKHNIFDKFKRQIDTLFQDTNGKSQTTDVDDDLAMTQTEINVIDPFSQKRMQNPVKNVCGHIYDYESVTAVVAKNKKTRCPYAGCKSKDYINLSKLTTDIITAAYLKKHPA